VSVTVSAANTPPSVTITNPADNAVFGNTDSVAVRGIAADSDGTVTNIQVFNGTLLLRTLPPRRSIQCHRHLRQFALGTNTLVAVATDNLGAVATSAPVHVVIERYLPAIQTGSIGIQLQAVATAWRLPTTAQPPRRQDAVFVLEQNGLIRVLQGGVLLPSPALDIQSRVQPPLNAANPNDERGLLGIAFHPGYTNPASPGYRTLYTYNSEMIPASTSPTYPVPTTATNNYKNVLNEWKISAGNASVIDPTSRREIISFGKTAGNHNGGTCTFGPDGYLYLALGDGGDANDVGLSHISPGGNAQNLTTPLGKFLRFDSA